MEESARIRCASFLVSNNEINLTEQYIGNMLLRLRTKKLIQRLEPHEHIITELGKEEIEEQKQLASIYSYSLLNILNKKIVKNTPDFEKEFSAFIDGQDYDIAENELFSIVRSAFAKGFNTAGSISVKPKKILSIVENRKK